jgi:L-asparaginase II
MGVPAHVPLVATTRGEAIECVHYGSIAVVDRSGRLVAGAGDPQSLNFTRSALKPFQALPFVEDGGMARFGFTSHELALMCASHNAEPLHLGIAKRILARVGAGEGDLQCGSHPPSIYAALGRTAPERPPRRPWSPLCHNCSGKHSGFLAWCRMHDRPLREYLAPDSPLQRRIRGTLERLLPDTRLARGTDGCSAPNYAMPLERLALLYCRLATEDGALAALRFAMMRHPDIVSGTGRMDLALMTTDKWVAKGGAAGLQAIGAPERGLGIAVRIADGNPVALRAAAVEALRQLDLVKDPQKTPLAAFAGDVVRNDRGREVGRIEARFTLGH